MPELEPIALEYLLVGGEYDGEFITILANNDTGRPSREVIPMLKGGKDPSKRLDEVRDYNGDLVLRSDHALNYIATCYVRYNQEATKKTLYWFYKLDDDSVQWPDFDRIKNSGLIKRLSSCGIV